MKYFFTYGLLILCALRFPAQVLEGDGGYSGMFQKTGFIENKGQITDQDGNPNPAALFILGTPGNNIVLKSNGFSYDTYFDEYASPVNVASELILPYQQEPNVFDRHYHRVDVHFEGCNESIEIETSGALAGSLNFYTAHSGESGIQGVRVFNRILYKSVYPNIDVEFLAIDDAENPYEYNFILHPGADINHITLLYSGMDALKLEEGDLLLNLSHGELKERIPLSYSHSDHARIDISYVIKSNGGEASTSFNGGDYTVKSARVGFTGLSGPTETGVTIDPTPLLLWSTYYGGTGSDYGYSVAKDLNGFLLVCGATSSNSLISTTGAQQITIGSSGVQDSFILKLDDLGVRQWCTYYGGTALDYSRSVVCDVSGNIYVVGDSESSAGISTTGSHQSGFGGIRDAYLLKLNDAGIRQWATYYGGSGQEFAGDICLDIAGNLVMVGNTGSSNSISTTGSFQNVLGGTTDGFIVKFNTSGTRIWGSFVGGLLTDAINAAAIDLSNNIYVVGNTVSVAGISTTGAFQTATMGNNDAFIMKFSPTGSRLWGTYYGGAGNDIGTGITCDISNFPCISGYTQSLAGLSTAGAHQVNFGGGNYDGFVARFNTAGARQWGTFFGGSMDDLLWNIAADDCGNMYTVGQTQSTSGISTADTHQGANGGLSDIYAAKFEETGIVIWSTYFGGTGQDYGRSLCLDQSLDIYVTGQAASTGLSTAGAHQLNHSGAGDAMIFKLYTYAALPIELISFQAIPNSSGSILTQWETATESNNALYTVERSRDGIHFEIAGTLAGAGNSFSYLRYEFEDVKPIYGLSYYRLKQTDYNGQYSYSNLVAVQMDGVSLLQVAPNPSIGLFRISAPFDGNLEVVSSSGIQVAAQKIYQGNNEIDLTFLPVGVYVFRFTGANESSMTKVVLHR